ncbi:MAG TPA: hypothetical protein VFO16_19570 [Pseudonocardiaceae bacterium]|nr:hypothetical protein [Pseudonocardiaceae bacterium]
MSEPETWQGIAAVAIVLGCLASTRSVNGRLVRRAGPAGARGAALGMIAAGGAGVALLALAGGLEIARPTPTALLSALGLDLHGVLLVPFGLLVGVGEFAAACFLTTVAADTVPLIRSVWPLVQRHRSQSLNPWARIKVTATMSPQRSATGSIGSNWLLLSRSSWALRWPALRNGTSTRVALALLVLQPLAEEALLRAGVISALRPFGWWCVLIAVVVAVPVVSWLPHARFELPTVVAVAVIAVVNSILFFYVPGILPIAAAQSAFFLVAST